MIQQLRIYKFKIDLSSSLKNKEGMAIYGKTQNGQEGWAEIAPLQGWSKETLIDAEKQLIFLKDQILQKCQSLDEGLEILSKHDLYPSVAFGMESLLFSLYAPETCLMHPFPVCALLTGSYEEIERQIPFILNEQYKCVKIKVSHLTFQEAHSIIGQLKNKIRLRIDVNRKWSLTESLCFFSHYPLDLFDYIEEPVQDPQDLSFFPFPIGLDETLREPNIPDIPHIKAFIIKPMMTGGLSQVRTIIEKAATRGAEVVFSSSFESGIGIYHLCNLLERLSIPVSPLGVDTYRLIKKDVLSQPHWIAKGMLKLCSLQVKKRLLKEIAYV